MIDEESINKLDNLLANDDRKILELPLKLFHPYRFLIMKILFAQGPVGFSELRLDLKLSDGNLASHLRVLEEGEFIKSQKEFKDKKPRTSYELTQKGEEDFTELQDKLRKVLVNER
ncbi:MAG: transcriptional regulator [Thaumarchaeota archaeon]|nr:transcriptional regulator [Nitrososphaerota archaeon]